MTKRSECCRKEIYTKSCSWAILEKIGIIMKLRRLQILVEQYGYFVERMGRVYQWWHKDDHSIVGECRTIRECFNEIHGDILSKVKI